MQLALWTDLSASVFVALDWGGHRLAARRSNGEPGNYPSEQRDGGDHEYGRRATELEAAQGRAGSVKSSEGAHVLG